MNKLHALTRINSVFPVCRGGLPVPLPTPLDTAHGGEEIGFRPISISGAKRLAPAMSESDSPDMWESTGAYPTRNKEWGLDSINPLAPICIASSKNYSNFGNVTGVRDVWSELALELGPYHMACLHIPECKMRDLSFTR